MPGEHLLQEFKNEGRSSSPSKRGREKVRVLPLTSVPMTGIPTVEKQANPKHGFVSRPGGAFKFRPLPVMSQSSAQNASYRNPVQELRALALKNAPNAACIRRPASSQAVIGMDNVPFIAGHKTGEHNLRSESSAVRRSRTPNATGSFSSHAQDDQVPSDVETSLLALKQLHKSLDSVSVEPEDTAKGRTQASTKGALPWTHEISAGVEAPAHPENRSSLVSGSRGPTENDERKEKEMGMTRPSTSLGLSSIEAEVGDLGKEYHHRSTAYDDILPSSIGRRSASRTPQLMWLHRRAGGGTGKRMRQLPPGALSGERINAEASRVFGELADEAVSKSMSGVNKFVEARALDLRLQDALSQGKLILSRPPLTEARQKYYAYIIPELFAVFDLVVDAAGPLNKVLKDLRDELYNLIYSEEKDFSQSVGSDGVAMPLVQQVSELKKGHDRLLAASATQTLLIKKADKEKEERLEDYQQLSLRVHQLEQELKANESSKAALQVSLDTRKQEYDILKVKFHELQKGFLLGQLQDEMKEILLGDLEEEKLSGGGVTEAMEEQSAMQKLIQQLKDSRQAMLNAQDDMNFWKGKYAGLQERMTTMQESFYDATNSLELTKEKMQNMVPSAVHVALKDRYQQVLQEMAKLRRITQKEIVTRSQKPDSYKDRPHDDWRLYGKEDEEAAIQLPLEAEELDEVEEGHAKNAGAGAGLADLDDQEVHQVPKDFTLSVAEQRDRLNEIYRTYRRMHSTSIVSWTQLKTMTLAEFARLEHDCFSKHSIWALAMLRSKD